MKFWELISVCRDQPERLKRVLQAHQETQLLEWIENINDIVSRQDRSVLDGVVDDFVCIAVLSEHAGVLYQATNYLRTYPIENEVELSFLEVFKKYGGSIIEETLEKGIAALPS